LPEKLIIISIFYSNAVIAELKSGFPNAYIFVVGEPDLLTEDGLLVGQPAMEVPEADAVVEASRHWRWPWVRFLLSDR
jgi:hypothetical protein